jgi:hypothetical protein
MMASGEIRLSTTTMRRMPVLAQSQGSALNDPNFFSSQEGANAPVYVLNYADMNESASVPALSTSYFSVAEVADAISDDVGFVSAAASFGEQAFSTAGELLHSVGPFGFGLGTTADFVSASNGGISQTQFNINLGVGIVGLLPVLGTGIGSTQYFLASFLYTHFAGGYQQGWQSFGTAIDNMSSNGLGP